MKIKTSELTGAALDWAVAKCEGLVLHKDALLNGVVMRGWHASGHYTDPNKWIRLAYLTYSTDWSQGGPIIERELIGSFYKPEADYWQAAKPGAEFVRRAPTPLIAAMRCYVASKLGDEVDAPEELL